MFIRTKDGNIYSVAKIRDDILVNTEKGIIRKVGYVVNELPISKCIINKEDVIKQADSKEELIDCYVFVSKTEETHYIYGFDYDMGVKVNGSRIEWDEAFKKHLLENGTVYGCIWTPKGLIFVSEYDKEKGKMVLI